MSAVLNQIGRPIGHVYGPNNVRWQGARGDGDADDTDSFLNAVNAARESGDPLIVPAGHYMVSEQILASSAGALQGVRILGAGSMSTRLESSVSSMSAVRLVKTDLSTFDRSAEISGISLIGGGGSNASGLEVVGQWFMRISDLVIDGFTSDGVWVPNRTDLDPSSDPWSSQFWQVDRLQIANCDGWGFNDEGQLALAGLFDNCLIAQNPGGGLQTTTCTLHFRNSTFAYNGSGGSNGGLEVSQAGGSGPFALVFERCEFDSNYNYNQKINVGSRILFIDSRDISTEEGGVFRPATQTMITGADGSVVNVKFIRPSRRATGSAALTWFDFGNSANVGDVEIIDLQDLGNTAALTRVANRHSSTVLHFNDYAGQVRSARMRRYHQRITVSGDQTIPTSTPTKIDFDTIDAPPVAYGQTAPDSDFNTSTNTWTAPFPGRAVVRGQATIGAGWDGNGSIYLYVGGVQTLISRYIATTAASQTTAHFAWEIDVAAGDTLDTRIEHAKGSDATLKAGNLSHLTIEYAAAS